VWESKIQAMYDRLKGRPLGSLKQLKIGHESVQIDSTKALPGLSNGICCQ